MTIQYGSKGEAWANACARLVHLGVPSEEVDKIADPISREQVIVVLSKNGQAARMGHCPADWSASMALALFLKFL